MTESPHGTDDPREIVDDLETRARAESTPTDGEKEESPDLAEGRKDEVAPKVPGSPEPPD